MNISILFSIVPILTWNIELVLLQYIDYNSKINAMHTGKEKEKWVHAHGINKDGEGAH